MRRPQRPEIFDGIERQVLLLGHADGDRLVVPGEQRAAEAAAARTQPADHAGLFARSDLAQLDAHLEGLGQIGHERAEVHPLVGVEAEGDLLPAEGDVGAHQLHVEAVLAISSRQVTMASLRSSGYAA